MSQSSDDDADSGADEFEKTNITLNDAMLLGNDLAYIREASRNRYPVRSTEDDNTTYIIETLEDIINLLSRSDIDSAILGNIREKKNELISSYEPGEKLNEADAHSLKEARESWKQVLQEEIRRLKRVSVSDIGLIDIEKAMEHPEHLFTEQNVWEKLPEETKDDLRESCRSIAFDCPTSGVFMALRAVEDRLQAWYEAETGNDIEDKTFGQVLSELEDHYGNDKPPILSHIDYLKERRNQVAHPKRSPNSQEAESTLVMVRETITNIHNQLNS